MFIIKIFYRFLLWLIGWKVKGYKPEAVKKYLIIVVPHTSNWDFILGVLARPLLGLAGAKYLAKKSLFDSPIGFVFHWLGGTPVDRGRKANMVDQAVEKYEAVDRFAITITPEGTRGYAERWKTGFYHIAHKAQVPIMMAYMDYRKRVVGLNEVPFRTSGNYEEDLKQIFAFYSDKIPRYPEDSTVHHGKGLKGRRFTDWYKLLLKLVGITVLLLALLNYELLAYGARQGYGQLNVLLKAEPVAQYLEDPAYPDSLKKQIKLVQEVKSFTVAELGLDPSGSYNTLYDQQGKPILWVVTACRPFKLENKEWEFPVLGTVSYKGHFSQQVARSEAAALKAEGWDTRVREVNGWSTLGILNDPILSNMLSRSEGDLAEVIIHELTHGTIFVRDNLQLNESLASFVGEKGALLFLKQHFGEQSEVYQAYRHSLADYEIYTAYVLNFTQKLDSLYQNMPTDWSTEQKNEAKKAAFAQFKEELFQLPIKSQAYQDFFERLDPNNAFFMAYLRYRGEGNRFEEEWETAFNGDLKRYIAHLKQKHPSIF